MPSLKKNSYGPSQEGPVVIVVMDGIGEAPNDPSNAVTQANTPFLDSLKKSVPWTQLQAHGTSVGMPSDKDMGNSEVGHNALGCGRVFDQGAKLVENAINSGELFEGEHWKNCVQRALNGGTLHFLGLLSDGNIHSHIRHLEAMLEKAKSAGVENCRVHGLLDGRDVGEYSALDYFEPLEKKLHSMGYSFASGGGRMHITMDRYGADWDMVERGWKTHVLGEGSRFPTATEAIMSLREANPGVTDQFLPSFVVGNDKRQGPLIHKGDAVIFFNFRGDRSIEITQAFEGVAPFQQEDLGVYYVGMMQYDGDLKLPTNFLVNPPVINETLGQWLAESKMKTLAISETQKYGHVTFFWNGNRSGYVDKNYEKYIEIPSDNVPFETAPKMKAVEITDTVIQELDNNFDHIRINYANGDMVGHTGDMQATITAVETVDRCLARLSKEVLKHKGTLLITADHGNADNMFDVIDGKKVVVSSHTLNPVPLYLVSGDTSHMRLKNNPDAGLANVAATTCDLLGFQGPDSYYPSLLERI